MANLFERMGLIRTEYDDLPATPPVPLPEISCTPEAPAIDTSKVSYEDIIPSIYEQGGVSDENSIFKIKAYTDILPPEMTRAKMQASIAGILAVNGINVADLINDGLARIQALEAADTSIKAESDALVAETEADIEHLKALIETADAKITESKQKVSDSSAAIQKEKEAVTQLLDFADGIAGKEGEK